MKVVKLLVCLFILTGCASTNPLGPMPKEEEEFLLSKPELIEKYPEIAVYEKVWRGFTPNHPLEENIIEVLGAPDKRKLMWGYPTAAAGTLLLLSADPVVWGLVIAIRPDIPRRYYYDKGIYCIEVSIDRSIITIYSQHMRSWKWMEDKEKCK